jgi:hypothetical protein
LHSIKPFLAQIKSPESFSTYRALSGERGIRTPGGVTLNGFQDRRIRPLCHFSFFAAKVHFFRIRQFIQRKFIVLPETYF